MKMRVGKTEGTLDHIVESIKRKVIGYHNIPADRLPLHRSIPVHDLLFII